MEGGAVMLKAKWGLLFMAMVLLFSSPCDAQWAMTYGEGGGDALSVHQDGNGGYIVGGTKNDDFWLARLFEDGSVDWEQTYGGTLSDQLGCMQTTFDGGYIMAGYISTGLGNNMWVIKIKNDKTIEWKKTYDFGLSVAQSEEPRSIQQTTDGGYIIAGSSTDGRNGNDGFLMKLFGDGAIDWLHTFGTSAQYNGDSFSSVRETLNTSGDADGYIVSGYFNTPEDSYDYALWVLKINLDGSIAWQKSYDTSFNEGRNSDIRQTFDDFSLPDGYILSTKFSTLGWVLRLDSNGEIDWHYTYQSPSLNKIQFNSVYQSGDGGFILAGRASYNDALILKLNPDGTPAWSKLFDTGFVEDTRQIQQTSDGGYIVTGFKYETVNDVLVLKLTQTGHINGCSAISTIDVTTNQPAESPEVNDTSVIPQNVVSVTSDSPAINSNPITSETSVVCKEIPETKLIASDAWPRAYFGYEVDISGDAIVVGAVGDSWGGALIHAGAGYVFRRDGTGWTEEAKLTADDAAEDDGFGYSVAISGDTVVVGVPYDNDAGYASGSAYVFRRTGSNWTQEAKLTAGDAVRADYFGIQVAISDDKIVVGAKGRDEACPGDEYCDSGSAYVFRRSGGSWTEEQELTASDAARGNYFGGSVAISGDTIVIGSPRWFGTASSHQSAYVFRYNGTNWIEEAKLTASDAALCDSGGIYKFGSPVDIDGDTVVIGAKDCDVSRGAAYVFRRSGGSWTEEQKLTASDASEWDQFFTATISGDTIVVGALGTDEACPQDPDCDSGSAYVFRYNGTTWIEEAKLTASDGFEWDEFGWWTAIQGDTTVIGAYGTNDACSGTPECFSGSAYVYELEYNTDQDNVVVQPIDDTTGTFPVTLTFSAVTQPGTTTLTTTSNGPAPPSGFQIGDPPIYYDITSSALSSGPIEVCVDYSPCSGTESGLILEHYEDTDGDGMADSWIDRTIPGYPINCTICASVDSFSMFAIFESSEVAPYKKKQMAIETLTNLLPTGDKKTDNRIEKAIEDIEKSLSPGFWENDTHLTKKGKKVFTEEKKAVHELMKVIKNNGSIAEDIQSVIDALVAADKTLALTAYEDAQAYSGDSKVDKELEKCEKELGKALEKTDKDDFEKAIEHYKKAWDHAQKAIRK